MPYLKYEASVLNQGPNQVHGTEMNRGAKNSLCARPNTSTTEPRPESRGIDAWCRMEYNELRCPS